MVLVIKWFWLSFSEFWLLLPQDVVIQTEDEIRVKIVGTRVDATDIVSELQILSVTSLVFDFNELHFNFVVLIFLLLYH